MRERLRIWARAAVVVLVIGLPAGAVLVFGAFQVSSQPGFCGSCHIMRPYYDSWLTSTHNDVGCVECHIPPGIESELRKKYEALSMVVTYFTGTYSTNPWAEVDDQSCLRSGCHAKRLLLGRELYRGVLFDHQPHLTEMRRSKQLRCTSCHSQIVQGSHITVTATSCILCHFKDTPPDTGTARCTLCHSVPAHTITTAGLSFDHGDVQRFDMNCMDCHEGVVKGEGDVPRERCLTCHNQPDRLQRYDETELMHRMHVTDHKVECLHCHIEIQHAVPDREVAVGAPCRSCHSPAAGHAAVRDLYRGIGAKGVTPSPAAMYLAGIRCEACHNRARGDHQAADEVSCMACHGPKYLKIYRSWQAGLRDRVEGMSRQLEEARAVLEQRDAPALAALADTNENLAFLRAARAIHNPGYAVATLEKSHQDVRAALAAAGEETLPGKPWTEAPYEATCLRCHFGVELLSGLAFGEPFPHLPHAVSAGIRCTVCHGEMEAHGTLELEADACADCHERIRRPMAEESADDCLTCHVADIGPGSESIRFPHDKHVASGLDCSLCHEGVGDLPHRQFASSSAARPRPEHAFCSTCHGEDVPAEDGDTAEDANCGMCHTDF
jgi:nitrate/TMAO reductase-like tetraheme cytochrome c subunit